MVSRSEAIGSTSFKTNDDCPIWTPQLSVGFAPLKHLMLGPIFIIGEHIQKFNLYMRWR